MIRRLPMLFAVALALACHKTPPHTPAPPSAAPATPPPAPPPAPATPPPAVDEYSRIKAMDFDSINRLGLLLDAHFDFDRSDVREDDRAALNRDAETLRRFDFLLVTVEGHCDERGSVEYNLALGERRARAATDYLVSLGVPAARLKQVSYGKEAPTCQEHAETCWARNRRAHVTVSGKSSSR
jgi:peptidoglycan-associated lipoprotein